VVGPHPGFQVNFGFRLVGMWMPLLVITRGTSLHWPRALWLNTVTSLAVGLECVVDLHGWSTSDMNVQVSTCDGLLAPYKYWVA
jgi:hypothetical protein